MLIGVAGMVGAGKTTLTRALAARFGLQLALESVDEDNPWLELFYRDTESRRQYSLELQLHFLATRFAAMRRMRAQGGSWILDRTWYEDAEVFAHGLYERGLMSRSDRRVKVLARGDVGKALTIRAHKFSGKAAEKIAAAGGTAEAIG